MPPRIRLILSNRIEVEKSLTAFPASTRDQHTRDLPITIELVNKRFAKAKDPPDIAAITVFSLNQNVFRTTPEVI